MLWIDEGGGFHENCVHETVYKWSTNENKFESVGEKKRFPIYMYNNPPPQKKCLKNPSCMQISNMVSKLAIYHA